MPIHDTRTAELCREVIEAAGLTQDEVANGCGLSRSMVNRVLSGQYAPPPCLTRWLWQRTGDERVVTAVLGDVRPIQHGGVRDEAIERLDDGDLRGELVRISGNTCHIAIAGRPLSRLSEAERLAVRRALAVYGALHRRAEPDTGRVIDKAG